MRFCMRWLFGLFSLFFVISLLSLEVTAYDVSNSKTLTASEAAELFGDTLTVKYFNGTNYVEQTATLSESVIKSRDFNPSLTDYDREVFDFSINWLCYSMTSAANTNPSYITIDFSPTTTFKNTEFLVTAVAVGNYSSNASGAISNTYASSTADVIVDGQKQQFTSFDNGDSIQGINFASTSLARTATVIPINLSLTKKSTVVLDRCCFYGTAGKYIYIRIPTVSLDTVAESGDTSGSGSGGSGGSVDLVETNGLLGNIIGWLQGVFDSIAALPGKIAGLFIPSDEFFDDWKNTVSALWSDHFGAVIQAIDIIASFVDVFQDVSAQDSIYIPTVTIDVGSPFTLGGWTVPLKPDGFSVLFESLALIIDILATCWVVNALKCRHDRILTGGAAD